jgi:hypothetical protein
MMVFEPGTQVEVKYPRTRAEHDGDRSAWPWLPGTVLEQCGPDEWAVDVEIDVTCFRDASEIRAMPS